MLYVAATAPQNLRLARSHRAAHRVSCQGDCCQCLEQQHSRSQLQFMLKAAADFWQLLAACCARLHNGNSY
jgi:hypothetical protein